MRQLTRLVTSVAALTIAVSPAAGTMSGTAAAAPSGADIVPMTQNLRNCDFGYVPWVGPKAYGRASALISTNAGNVAAEVHFATGVPNTSYIVRLIQVPRPSSMPCRGADPGVVAVPLITDAAGGATATLQDTIRPEATGAWVFISLPGQFSQTPAEFYTSDLISKF